MTLCENLCVTLWLNFSFTIRDTKDPLSNTKEKIDSIVEDKTFQINE